MNIDFQARMRLENLKVHFSGPVGSIEGPRQVLDPFEVSSCCPRFPWIFFVAQGSHQKKKCPK